MTTCAVCLLPVATDADQEAVTAWIWHAKPLPEGWTDSSGDHLCWCALYPELAPCAAPVVLPDDLLRTLGAVANALGDRCPPPDAPPEAWAAAVRSV